VSALRFIALAALGLALGAGCAAALPRPTATTVARAQGRWPDSTMEQLEHGRAVFAQHCSGCHALPLPDSHSEPEWKKVLDEMAAEAKLSPDERVLVERFVLAVRTRAD
jgi:cytochrome c5